MFYCRVEHMPGATFIEGERVDLKTIAEEDLDFLQRGVNHPSINPFLSIRPKNRTQMRRRFEQFISDENGINLVVVPQDGEFEGEPVGHVWINPIDELNGTGIVGVWFLPKAQRKQYAHDSLVHLVDHAFEQVGLRRLEINTADSNVVIRRLCKRGGFTHEVERRGVEFIDGEFVSHHKYGILAEEWEGRDELLENIYGS